MLHGSETWSVWKENEMALQRSVIRMIRWMCDVKVKDRVPSTEMRNRLRIDDIILVLQQNRLQLAEDGNKWRNCLPQVHLENSKLTGECAC